VKGDCYPKGSAILIGRRNHVRLGISVDTTLLEVWPFLLARVLISSTPGRDFATIAPLCPRKTLTRSLYSSDISPTSRQPYRSLRNALNEPNGALGSSCIFQLANHASSTINNDKQR